MTPIEQAADALRRFEMVQKRLNDWDRIAPQQRRRWMLKAKIVLDAFDAAEAVQKLKAA